MRSGGMNTSGISKQILAFDCSKAAKPARTAASEGSITLREYLAAVTSAQRRILAKELAAEAVRRIEGGESIYLEGLGIAAPRRITAPGVYTLAQHFVLREEVRQHTVFEKCSELTGYHRQRYSPLCELKDLVKRIYARLPLQMAVRWSENDLRRLLRGLMKHVIYEVVTKGCSRQLAPLGVFYALHNRQGSSVQDWYAGADIFLEAASCPAVESGPSRLLLIPELQDAWEPLRCVYGDPLAVLSIPLRPELQKLGYALAAESEPEINVAVFERRVKHSRILLYCTEGLRRAAYQRGTKQGVELVFQACLPEDDLSAPAWPFKALALGWVLVQSSRSGAPRTGVGLGCEVPLSEDEPTRLSTIFSTEFSQIPRPCKCSDGPFSYLNLVGITEREALLARTSSPAHLTILLRRRQLDQVTKLNRPCLVCKTEVEGKDSSGEEDALAVAS